METKSNLNRTRKQILQDESDRVNILIKWDIAVEIKNVFTFSWRGHGITVNVKTWYGNAPLGYRTHYTFTVNSKVYIFNILKGYLFGTHGAVPDLRTDLNKLTFKAGPCSLEIIESPLHVRPEGVFPELTELEIFNEYSGGVRNIYSAKFSDYDLVFSGKTIDYRESSRREHDFFVKVEKGFVKPLYRLFKLERIDTRDFLEYMEYNCRSCWYFPNFIKLLKENNIPYSFYSSKNEPETNCPCILW